MAFDLSQIGTVWEVVDFAGNEPPEVENRPTVLVTVPSDPDLTDESRRIFLGWKDVGAANNLRLQEVHGPIERAVMEANVRIARSLGSGRINRLCDPIARVDELPPLMMAI